MRKLYNKFFYIPKHGKVRDNVMLVRSAFTLAIMVVCLIAMSVTAYAYFSANVTSGANMIKAANFDVNISVTDSNTTDSNTKANVDIPTTVVGRETVLDFKTPGTYTVTLAKAGSADTGFCIITANGIEYITQQIGVDVSAPNQYRGSVVFELQVIGSGTLKIVSHGGTSSNYYDNINSLGKIIIDNSVKSTSVDETESITVDKSDNNTTQSANNAVPENTVTNEPTATESSSTVEPSKQESIIESVVTDSAEGTENQPTTDNE